MGKRSSFKRRPQDAYDTPAEAVAPLVPHLPRGVEYGEPCGGSGQLAYELSRFGFYCVFLSDIEPRGESVIQEDAFNWGDWHVGYFDYIITNPPWTRAILHPMIEHFSDLRPTWLLFDADWMHTKQAIPYMERCRKIVSVGRVKWIPDSPHTGKDNACWYLFDNTGAYPATGIGPVFIGRKEKAPRSAVTVPEGLNESSESIVTIAEQTSFVNVSPTVFCAPDTQSAEQKCGPSVAGTRDVGGQ